MFAGFALLFNVRGLKFLFVAAGGLLSWVVYLAVESLSGSEVLGYFISAAAMSVYSEIMARTLKSPTTTFIIPTLVPLIPGGSLYKTMRYALSGSVTMFSGTGLNTLKLAAALALGTIISAAFFKPIIRYISVKEHRKRMLKKHLEK